jgi:flagellar basal-body rod modification protein FlgD
MSQTSAISGALGQDQFLQLLIAQLQNQDPLDPVSDRDFIAQLATLSQLQGIQDLNANFGEMLKLQQLTNGASLLGKTVEYTPVGGGPTASGTVRSLAAEGGQFVLVVGEARVGLDQISAVQDLP